MANASQVSASLRKSVNNAVRMLALEIDAELRRSTPVDTGHARRNWVPSVGTPHSGVSNDDSAHAHGIQAVLAYEIANGALWVANAVPYIQRLNYGHSAQAPAGFVEASIDRAMSKVRAKLQGTGIDISGLQDAFRAEVSAAAAGNMASAYNPLGGDDD